MNSPRLYLRSRVTELERSVPENIILYDADGNEVEVPAETPSVRQMRDRIKELEAEALRAKELETQLAASQEQSALKAAELALDADKLTAFKAVHKGDWTPEAVKETAIKLGWAEAPQQVPPGEQEAQARMQAATSGGSSTPPDPEAVVDAKLAQAKNAQEFMELYRETGRPLAP